MESSANKNGINITEALHQFRKLATMAVVLVGLSQIPSSISQTQFEILAQIKPSNISESIASIGKQELTKLEIQERKITKAKLQEELKSMRQKLIIRLESGKDNLTPNQILKVSRHGEELFFTNGGGVTEFSYHKWQLEKGVKVPKPLDQMTIEEYYQIQDSYLLSKWKKYPESIKAFLQQVFYNSPKLYFQIEAKFEQQFNFTTFNNHKSKVNLLEQMTQYLNTNLYPQSDKPTWAIEGLINRGNISLNTAKEMAKKEKELPF